MMIIGSRIMRVQAKRNAPMTGLVFWAGEIAALIGFICMAGALIALAGALS